VIKLLSTLANVVFLIPFFLISSGISADYYRTLDFNIGAGATLPAAEDITRNISSQISGRIGLSFEHALLKKSSSLFWNAGVFLSRKGMAVGNIGFEENWTFTMAETQINLLYLFKKHAPIHYSTGISLIPIYNFQYHVQSPNGTFSLMNEIKPFQFDLGVFTRLELGGLGIKPYFHYNLTSPVHFTRFSLHQLGIEFLLPLVRTLDE